MLPSLDFYPQSQWDPLKILSRSESLLSILVQPYSDCSMEIRGGRAGDRVHLGGWCNAPGGSDGRFN